MKTIKIKYIIFFILMSSCVKEDDSDVFFVGDKTNDLYQVISNEDLTVDYFEEASEAIRTGSEGVPIIVVADEYPDKKVQLDDDLLVTAKKKNLRLYIEYPKSLPNVSIGDSIIETKLERGIVVSEKLVDDLKPMSILGITDGRLVPAQVDSSLIVSGKVAGFNEAVYGVDDITTHPILFQEGNNIIATTKLSDFATSRYEPSNKWKKVWEGIISKMLDNDKFQFEEWLSYVKPQYKKGVNISVEDKNKSIVRGVDWFYKARLFIDESWESLWRDYQGDGVSPVGPQPHDSIRSGDGRLGIIEGPTSKINFDGTQDYRYWVRADDQGEAAYALSATAHLMDTDTLAYAETASNLLDFLFETSNLRAGEKNKKESDVYGLIGWAETHPGTFYVDDNARTILGAIGSSAYLGTDKWDGKLLENILSNFRTTGKEGFRGDRLEEEDILEKGWQHYWNRSIVHPDPHHEAWPWAVYLWLYDKTGYEPLLNKTKKAIKLTMEKYPNDWEWMNGLQQERARMILPLAWLVRVENTKQHREWLDAVTSDLISYQDSTGAIQEALGKSDKGKYGATKSNEDYGKTEAPLIFENGDPVSDMLYTTNFAFFSLNEAYHATEKKEYKEAVDKLSDFLTRIQVNSVRNKNIDGAWFRAFDYENWTYWGSNADAGWGAWATLSGWTQSWIIATQVLYIEKKSYWELTEDSKIENYMDKVKDLLPE